MHVCAHMARTYALCTCTHGIHMHTCTVHTWHMLTQRTCMAYIRSHAQCTRHIHMLMHSACTYIAYICSHAQCTRTRHTYADMHSAHTHTAYIYSCTHGIHMLTCRTHAYMANMLTYSAHMTCSHAHCTHAHIAYICSQAVPARTQSTYAHMYSAHMHMAYICSHAVPTHGIHMLTCIVLTYMVYICSHACCTHTAYICSHA